MGADADALLPSVRCGLEAGLLNAMAHAKGISLSELLMSSKARFSLDQTGRSAATGGSLAQVDASQSSTVASVAALKEQEEPDCANSRFKGAGCVYLNSLVDDTGGADEACQHIVHALQVQGSKAVKVKAMLSRVQGNSGIA